MSRSVGHAARSIAHRKRGGRWTLLGTERSVLGVIASPVRRLSRALIPPDRRDDLFGRPVPAPGREDVFGRLVASLGRDDTVALNLVPSRNAFKYRSERAASDRPERPNSPLREQRLPLGSGNPAVLPKRKDETELTRYLVTGLVACGSVVLGLCLGL
ncbi:uncharacterized protein LOC126322555 [Schistocerca gregaria]|uniref:uncharacterized protein LOC126322555 n=1 Tax=Schistocerca gregaria TaxID=7010 RepID=UPI00211EDFD8|nr:uncharacterized protein LOC126322555 [Schistocerca gregaria]